MDFIKEKLRDFDGYVPKQAPIEIKLDSNEGKNILLDEIFPDGITIDKDFMLNLYPDNTAEELRSELSEYAGVNVDKIIVGNGSNEMIELIMKAFIDKDEVVMSFVPTFQMFGVFAQVYNGKFIGIESEEDFSLDIEKIINRANEEKAKVIFLCYPNNPTGYLMSKEDIIEVIERTNSIVVVDEAYCEFSKETMVKELDNYENLIILRTLSKAFGLAGIRLGYLMTNKKLAVKLDGIRTAYNLNALSQSIGVLALQNKEKFIDFVDEVIEGREMIYNKLIEFGMKPYKSYGSFVLYESEIEDLYQKLMDNGISIRHYAGKMDGFYRVSIGNKEENDRFIKTLEEIIENESC